MKFTIINFFTSLVLSIFTRYSIEVYEKNSYYFELSPKEVISLIFGIISLLGVFMFVITLIKVCYDNYNLNEY